MKIEYPEYYNRFRCIADRCPDTCCAGWEVDVDDDMYYYYKVVPGKIGEKIRRHMKEDGEDKYFPLTKQGRCPFLDPQGLCEIYAELGEESLCRVCTEYPRYYMEIGDYEQIDLSLSCMELGRIVFTNPDPIRYERREDDDDFEDITKQEQALLLEVLQNRDRIISILQDRSLPLSERLHRAGLPCMTSEDLSAAKLLPLFGEFEILNEDWACLFSVIGQTADTLDESILSFEESFPNEYSLWFEKLAVYLTWRYWIDGFFEEDPSSVSSVRLIRRSLYLIKMLCAVRMQENKGSFTVDDMIDVAHIFSRQVEHSDENIDLMKTNESFG